MRLVIRIFGTAMLALIITLALHAQDASAVQQSTGKTSSTTAKSGTAQAAPTPTTDTAAESDTTGPTTHLFTVPDAPTGSVDNPYDPILEPPPLPKGKATLIGGIATNVDHVRNRVTIQPFGKGEKIKVVLDERSHIYRNGTPTTVLGIHKGDRVYVDTLLDPTNNKVLAQNLRVITDTGLAEVRGQVIATRPDKGTITLRDELSSKSVTFSVGGNTSYTATKGTASASDVQPGSLIDVQFAPRRSDHDVARQIIVIAKPGDNYIFAGVVTNLDLRSDSLFVDNKSDDQSYELHFTPADVADLQQLKVGSEVTARAVFDGKQYKASNITVEHSSEQAGEQSKAQ